ncbi:hypothetical protein ACVXHA_25085 [Escherichia coli]
MPLLDNNGKFNGQYELRLMVALMSVAQSRPTLRSIKGSGRKPDIAQVGTTTMDVSG